MDRKSGKNKRKHKIERINKCEIKWKAKKGFNTHVCSRQRSLKQRLYYFILRQWTSDNTKHKRMVWSTDLCNVQYKYNDSHLISSRFDKNINSANTSLLLLLFKIDANDPLSALKARFQYWPTNYVNLLHR